VTKYAEFYRMMLSPIDVMTFIIEKRKKTLNKEA